MASPMEPGSPKATPSLRSPTPSHSNLPLDEANNIVSTQPQYPQTSAAEAYSVTPSRSPTNSDFDSLIQGALSSLTPAQIQQLMNSISMTSYPDFPASGPEQDTALMSYQPPLDFSQLTSLPLISSPSPPSTNLMEEADKSWTDMEEIEQDVDTVDTKINNLCQQFHIPNDASSASLGSIGLGDGPPSIPNPSDNDLFHSFLNGLGDESTIIDADNTTSTAFLDEIPTAPASDGTLSPFSILQEQSTPITPKQAKKRKSTAKDPASTDDADTELSLGTRAKRRKDR
ncbi:hypothetical protein GGX14DRAFT_589671 [Mycena pura]|uniref:Uncharacterized protein n=1 Tax=Mycena pura TaxID=153505 RepID=A0AAD6YI72_9AGAR|nr:hypothetical protein GGX14DRAFT_589671 [Mycena pura]